MKQIVCILACLLASTAMASDKGGHGPGPRFRGGREDQPHAPLARQEISLPASAIATIGIKTEKVQRRECPCILKALGKVLAPQTKTAIVSHFLPGRLAKIHVQVGEWVRQGQPLVTLECAEIGDAMSEFFKAVAARELAQLNLAREKRLAESGIGAKKQYIAAEADHKVAEATFEAAEKRLHILGLTEDQVKEIAQTHKISPTIVLSSPIEGKVVTSKAIVGAMVDQSMEILTIIDPRMLWVDAGIYEKDVAKVKIGQKVEVTVPAFPRELFRGKITYISDVVNEETRTITVRTEVDNRDERLKPGMFAEVSIFYSDNGPVVAVPVEAILEDGEKQLVFVREKEGFVQREIETGATYGMYRQVIKGLQDGEEVVIEGNHELKSKLSGAALRGAHID